MNWFRIQTIMLKELRQLRRDRMTSCMVVIIPLLQLVLFGYAINLDVRGLSAAVLDLSDTAVSREVVAEIGASQVLDLRYWLHSAEEGDRLLRAGRIHAVLTVPADFAARLARHDVQRPPLQLVVDGSDLTIQASARQLTEYRPPGWRSMPALEVVNLYNPERLTQVNTVPGLVGLILALTMVLYTANGIVRERDQGNMEMLISTPVTPWELALGKLLPFVGIGIIQASIVLLAGNLLFQVPLRGSLLELYMALLVFILANLTLGVLVSTIVNSQFQALQLAFLIFVPQILLSGFAFPFSGMPPLAQWIAEILPMTHFLRLVRGIMLRGAPLIELWQEMLMLSAFAVMMMTIAVTRLNKSLG